MADEPMLTTEQVARRLNVNAETIRRWVKAERLPAVTLPSGRLRFRPEVVDALIANHT